MGMCRDGVSVHDKHASLFTNIDCMIIFIVVAQGPNVIKAVMSVICEHS
jgi:hypothetical protein